MSVWEDVVTTGLIGTDRRPVPDELPVGWGTKELDRAVDPAHAMLSLAARHRAVTRAGGLLQSCPPGAVAPPSRTPVASYAAHEILLRLLSPLVLLVTLFANRKRTLHDLLLGTVVTRAAR